MSTTRVTADGPITLMDSQGMEIVIPLAALYIDASGTVKTDQWPAFARYGGTDQNVITAWLATLLSGGSVSAAPAAQAVPAMTLRATNPGAAGNALTAVVANVTANADPTRTTFDLSIVATQAWTALTPATVETALGTDANPLAQPGLVDVVHGTVDATKTVKLPQSKTFPTSAAAKSTTNLLDKDHSTDVTLQANRTFGTTKLALSNVDDTKHTFTLVATWSEPAVESKTYPGIKISGIKAALAGDPNPIVKLVGADVNPGMAIDTTKTSYTFDAPSGATKPTKDIAGTPGAVCTLEAQRPKGQATVTFANFSMGADPTFDMTVTQSGATETEEFDGLTLETIEAALGSDAAPTEPPKLIGVVHGTVKPNGAVDKTQTAPVFPAPAATSNAQVVTITDAAAATVFTLEATETAGTTAVSLVASATAGAFDMTATWTLAATGLTVLTVQTATASLAGLVTIAAPPGGAFSVPAAGSSALAGGSDTPSLPASATLFAST